MPLESSNRFNEMHAEDPKTNLNSPRILAASRDHTGDATVGGSLTGADGRRDNSAQNESGSLLDEYIRPVIPFIIPEHIATFNRLWPNPRHKAILLHEVMCTEQGETQSLNRFLFRRLVQSIAELERLCSPIFNCESGERVIYVVSPESCVPSDQQQTSTEQNLVVEPKKKAEIPLSSTRHGHQSNQPKEGQTEDSGLIMPQNDSSEVKSSLSTGSITSNGSILRSFEQHPDNPHDADDIVFFDQIPDIVPNTVRKSTKQEIVCAQYTNMFGLSLERTDGRMYGLSIIVCDSLETVVEDMLSRKNELSTYDTEDYTLLRRQRIESQPLDEVLYHVDFSSATFKDSDGVEMPCTELYHIKEKVLRFIKLVREFYSMSFKHIVPGCNSTYAECHTQVSAYREKHIVQSSKVSPLKMLPCNCNGRMSFRFSSCERILAIKVRHKHHKHTPRRYFVSKYDVRNP